MQEQHSKGMEVVTLWFREPCGVWYFRGKKGDMSGGERTHVAGVQRAWMLS